ncbi:MAG: trypsin-like peptidase domain-containing protein, partial [Actinomycetota bacterium]|nr:trypsin-like peptidase domain-containing protein [Actinomycetota bacterium]
AHIVAGARDVAVRFNEDEELVGAELVGSDLSTDLALLKVEPGRLDLRPLELGNSERVRVGEPVMAVGNPFGFEDTVTTGIVSALQRQISAPNRFTIDDVIQTDASINPGNSGGPLLDAGGRVIGVNSQIASPAGGSVGIGFAVPINTAKRIVPDLQDDGRVERAFLGVTTAPVTEEIARALGLPVDEGALVQEVVEGGPADRAGLRAGTTRTSLGLIAGGDLIVRADGRQISDPQDLSSAIADNKPGDRISLEFVRDGERRNTTVELGRRPAPSAERGAGGPDEGLPFPFP